MEAQQADAPTVVVTGASKGIGAAVVRRLAADGYRVVAGVRRTEDAEALRGELGDRVVPALLDVTDPEAVAATAALVGREVGERGLAGLVNNAGIAVAAPLEFLPPERLRRQLEVNVVGQHAVTKALLPLLRRGHGRIVNLGSIGGRIASPLTGAYAASKFALRGLTDSLRLVARALTVQRPRARYLVGRDAHIAAMVARLPDRLRDRLVLSRLG